MRDYKKTISDLRNFNANYEANKLTNDAADAIEELQAKVPRWISVEERLPEDQGDDARMARGRDYIHKVIAVSVTPNYTAMDTAYLYNGRWALGQYTSWEHFMGAPVTHWMPLPAAPKEVQKDELA